jgi:hypothetical protein
MNARALCCAMSMSTWLAFTGCRATLQPVPDGAGDEYGVRALELDLPEDCALTIDVRLQQQRADPGGGTHDANVPLRVPETAPPSTLRLGRIDLSMPLTIVAEILRAEGQCDPYVPPARWEFSGTVQRDASGGFSVPLSQFTLVFSRER